MAEFLTRCASFSALREVNIVPSTFQVIDKQIERFSDCKPELQMMYAGTKLALVKEAELTKVFEIRELDELTEEWLHSKLLR